VGYTSYNDLRTDRSHAVQKAIAWLDGCLEGRTRFADYISLREVLGDFHAEDIQQKIHEKYGVTKVAGVVVVDSKRIETLAAPAVRTARTGNKRDELTDVGPKVSLINMLSNDMYHHVMNAADPHDVMPVGMADALSVLPHIEEGLFASGLSQNNPDNRGR
jgi:hypothetical protein